MLLIENLKGKKTEKVPVWMMRQAGRYLPEYRELRETTSNFLEFCYTPEKAAEATLHPIIRFNMDAAIIFSDILVVPDALGQKVWFEKGHGPRLEPLETEKDIEALETSRITEKLEPMYQAMRMVRAALDPQKALIGFCGAPFTVACYMLEGKGSKDFPITRLLAYKAPETFRKLIDILVNASAQHLINQVNAGANAVQIFDSWSGILAEDEFAKWVIQPTREIVLKFREACPNIPVIGFPRGAALNYIPYCMNAGVDALGVDTQVPLQWAAENLQNYLPIQGNLDPQLLAADAKATQKRTQQILDAWGHKPFIFNLGHGIVPHTPIEHVEAMLEVVRNFKRAV